MNSLTSQLAPNSMQLEMANLINKSKNLTERERVQMNTYHRQALMNDCHDQACQLNFL